MNHDRRLFLDCGGHTVSYAPSYEDTVRYFSGYLSEKNEGSMSPLIRVDRAFMEKSRWLVSENEESEAYLEFQCLMLATGNHLITCSRALFHGVAFIWRGMAWILTAPSGTGKTTQYRLWRRLCGRDVKIINGDKPLLECRDDGSVWTYSSPWRGKERYGIQGASARLGGIVLLEQGDSNRIRRMSPQEAVLPLWAEFVSFPENEEQIRGQARILDRILSAVPVWKLTNLGDEASTRMTQKVLGEYLKEMKKFHV